ncbi:amidophosphoribosyltransferase [Candidatus Omnitrophota bacterium]
MSGVFGAISKKDIVRTLFYGTDYHTHLGTQFGGLAVLGDKLHRQIHDISQSQFKSKFFDNIQMMKGTKGVGVISDSDEQPIYLNSKFGEFCLVMTGLITNKVELKKILFKQGISFSEVSNDEVNAVELIAKLISLGDTLIDGIEKMFDVIEGSCSLLILNEDGIYAARDRLGYTPLTIGLSEDSWAVTTESCAFLNLKFKTEKVLAPGEIVLLTDEGLVSKRDGNATNQICSFYWIYTGFPASNYEGINVEGVREQCGAALAKRDKDIDADVVAGVPDSGIAHAIGYAMESKTPYRRPLIKYTPGYGRSYTPPNQETRDLVATMKLIPIKEIIEGNKLVILDDSIVRGTQLKNFAIKKLWDCGAKEVHARPACPPLMFPCKFCLSTRTHSELIARRAIKELEGKDLEDISEYLDDTTLKYQKMIDWIAKDMGVTTLRYQNIDDMVEAIGIPKEKLCTYCWDGACPKAAKKTNG